jgi:NAD-dependent SIR2 family protein deacetylase
MQCQHCHQMKPDTAKRVFRRREKKGGLSNPVHTLVLCNNCTGRMLDIRPHLEQQTLRKEGWTTCLC